MPTETNIDFKNLGSRHSATVVGIYGLPGSGKTAVLNALRERDKIQNDSLLAEGSDTISKLVKGGLEGFQNLRDDDKASVREHAIQAIVADCMNDLKPAIVTGHFMFWSNTEDRGTTVWTAEDQKAYTHIIYLNTVPEMIYHRRQNDTTKLRPKLSIDQLRRWQRQEEKQLRSICYQSGIIYCALGQDNPIPKVMQLLDVFLKQSQAEHVRQAQVKLDGIIGSPMALLTSAFVLDADKTLSAADSGQLFWECLRQRNADSAARDHLSEVFGGPLGYTSAAFLQVALLYEEVADQGSFDAVCTEIAEQISLYPEVEALLWKLHSYENNTFIIVVTCGIRLIWEKVLQRRGLFHTIKVIGSGPLNENQVITAHVKEMLAARLRQHYNLYVVAMGDSVLDLGMFAQANRAVVIVGDEQTRSCRMESELLRCIVEDHRISACQAVLARGAPPRLGTAMLPLVELDSREFWDHIVRGKPRPTLNIIQFTSTRVSKILASPMRDSTNRGPALQNAHRQTGQYLALQALPDLLGVEDYPIPHVQGQKVSGTRIAFQTSTLIVALMRGGEPMALGVNEVLPAASFSHARNPDDIKPEHVEGMLTVILVDSVINSGNTVVDFIRHLTALEGKANNVRIVVIAGVVQKEAISNMESRLQEEVVIQHRPINLVALRFSDNKFTGHKGTDTGNRLFNTTKLA